MGDEGERDHLIGKVPFSTPLAIAVWLEPLLCDRLLIDWGGHVFYDSAIPAGAVLYYAVASQLPPKKASAKAA